MKVQLKEILWTLLFMTLVLASVVLPRYTGKPASAAGYVLYVLGTHLWQLLLAADFWRRARNLQPGTSFLFASPRANRMLAASWLALVLAMIGLELSARFSP